MRVPRVVIPIAILAILATTGCAPVDGGESRSPSATTSTTKPSVSAETIDDVGHGACDSVGPQLPVDDNDPEQLGGMSLLVPVDQGARPHANGEVLLDVNDIPAAYIVAENDNWGSIGARFCLGELYLGVINGVRRDGDAVYVGDTINLDAHTMLSVGDQNGVALTNPIPSFAIPPQR